MFLHIGGDVSVFLKDVLALLDASGAQLPANRAFLAAARAAGTLTGQEPCVSYVVTLEGGAQRVYASPISSQTLQQRAMRGL